MQHVTITAAQLESADATERDEPVVFDGTTYNAYKLSVVPSSERDVATDVMVVTEPGSQEDMNIQDILQMNDESITAGVAPNYNLKISGFAITLSRWHAFKSTKVEHEDYQEEAAVLDWDIDGNEDYLPMIIVADDVGFQRADEQAVHSWSASKLAIFCTEQVNAKGEPFRSVSARFEGYDFGDCSNQPTHSLNPGNAQINEQLSGGDEKANELHLGSASGPLGFYESQSKGEEGLTKIRFTVTRLFVYQIIPLKDQGGISKATTPPISREVVEDDDSTKALKEKLKANAAKQAQKQAEDTKEFVDYV